MNLISSLGLFPLITKPTKILLQSPTVLEYSYEEKKNPTENLRIRLLKVLEALNEDL